MAHLTWKKNNQSTKHAVFIRAKRKQQYILYISLALNVGLLAYVILIK